MTFVVVYDACVLYPSFLRDVLIRVAKVGMVQAKWTGTILDEVFENLSKDRPDLRIASLARTRALMEDAIRDCMVRGYEPLIEALSLPDPDDRHVLAAAIRSNAQVIVTSNVKDFPASDLAHWDVEAKSPDDFLVDQIDLNVGTIWRALQQIMDASTRPPMALHDIRVALERNGLNKTVAALDWRTY